MKRWIVFYRALQALCIAAQLGLFAYAANLCVLMSGGYMSGWSASYCLPRALCAAMAILALDWPYRALGDWIDAEKEYARKKLLYGGYLSTQYAKRDGRGGGAA